MGMLFLFISFVLSEFLLIPGAPCQDPFSICNSSGCSLAMATAENLPTLIQLLKNNGYPSAAVAGWNNQAANLVLRDNGALAPYDRLTNDANAAICLKNMATCPNPCPKIQVLPQPCPPAPQPTPQPCQPIICQPKVQLLLPKNKKHHYHKKKRISPCGWNNVPYHHKNSHCTDEILRCRKGEYLVGGVSYVDPCQGTAKYLNLTKCGVWIPYSPYNQNYGCGPSFSSGSYSPYNSYNGYYPYGQYPYNNQCYPYGPLYGQNLYSGSSYGINYSPYSNQSCIDSSSSPVYEQSQSFAQEPTYPDQLSYSCGVGGSTVQQNSVLDSSPSPRYDVLSQEESPAEGIQEGIEPPSQEFSAELANIDADVTEGQGQENGGANPVELE